MRWYVGEVVVLAVLAGPAVDLCFGAEGAGAEVGETFGLGGVVGGEDGVGEKGQ